MEKIFFEVLSSEKSIKEIKASVAECGFDEYDAIIAYLSSDARKAVQTLCSQLVKRKKVHEQECERMLMMYRYENELKRKGFKWIAGIDEVGRGPLIGPVVAAAVILDDETDYFGIDDSKKLTAEKRAQFHAKIIQNAVGYGIGMASHDEIDEINILNATKLAMKRAVEALKKSVAPEYLLIDALKLDDIPIKQLNIIKGDEKSASIAAASIVAKVTRDALMQTIHEAYPHYGFNTNMGYGTDLHYDGIRKYGVTPFHRKSFLKNFK
ncbi:ribonuclease HII [Fusibacter sp. 3D3]|uniref:ribonuclease HII n=1 Tax=Fusibacter sp. 3D3 TaxID=1048380 RepID=UPI000853DCC3|nr:ribonuclease HII [Fusibacter sp. 3D3]GAU78781.1 ribonuclease HII [Fusibacter sp. 3D3]